MSGEQVLEVFLDALKDSALVFAFVFLVHFILSFFGNQLENFLIKRKKTGPLFGSLFGLIPQCGTSVLGADLYIKKYITIGTLTAVFLSCSDEAFIALLTSGVPEKMLAVLPLLGLKFAIGFVVGFVVDLIARKQQVVEVNHVEKDKECEQHHHENTPVHEHLIHPLIHSLEILAYVLVINFGLGLIIEAVGRDNFSNFLLFNKYLTPLFASIVGLIPNCASSLLLTELFVEGSISFGALLAGLLVNSGLGMLLLLRKRKSASKVLLIIGICFATAITAGYITCFIVGF